jgi:U3 small nucleolar RNA-associated protein 22
MQCNAQTMTMTRSHCAALNRPAAASRCDVLRRWQDGKITETAVWEVPPQERHVIPDLILFHVVRCHLPPGSAVAAAAASLDWALASRACPPGADITASRAAEAAADKLAKQLRALDSLALKVGEKRAEKGAR